MAKRSSKTPGKPRKAKRRAFALPPALASALPVALTAGALLLGGLGIGLFIGTQIRPSAPPPGVSHTPPRQAQPLPRPPVQAMPAPPAAPSQPATAPRQVETAPSPTPAPPPAPTPAPVHEYTEAAPPPPVGKRAETPARQQVAIASLPKPPAAFAGRPPWLANAMAAPATHGKPMIAVVLDDMGLDRKRSARAVALIGPLTLSFLPYAEELPQQTATARANGHELMVHVPMQPLGQENPGPRALTTDLSPDEIASRLERDLTRFTGFVGINNHMGSKFTQNAPGMAVVIGELRARGLLWLDSRTANSSVGGAIARAYEVPHVDRDVFLDHNPALAAVQRQLADLEATARRRGWAVAIGHPKDTTLDALTQWLPRLAERGFVLVPLSHIVRNATGPVGAG